MINLISKLSMKYVLIAVAVLFASNVFLFNRWQNAKDDVTAAVAQCNQDKLTSIAEAERITREAVQAAADRRETALKRQLELESKVRKASNEALVRAEKRVTARDEQLRQLAEDAFDEDDLPDSNACLNAFVTSRALRCVFSSGDSGEAGAGALRGDALCADPSSIDGVHPGFSNITYRDALQYWGSDRDAAIQLNGRLVQIRDIQGEVIDDGD